MIENLSGRQVLLVGGAVYPTPDHPPVEAILIANGRVKALGAESELRNAISGRVEQIDLGDATITAGFTDAHIHITTWALFRKRISLIGTRSPGEAAERVARLGTPLAGVIRGHGWNAAEWPDQPTREDLDRLIPDVPVFLDSQDLHSAWLNSAALRLCQIDELTDDPPGGRILRDPRTGEPTGLLLEAARALAAERLPAPSIAETQVALIEAQEELHRFGITGIHSVESTGPSDLRRLVDAGRLRMRVLQHIQLDQLESAIAAGLRSGFGDDWLRVGGVKMFLDGSLGSRTAWLREPYVGSVDDRGMNTLDPAVFRAAVERASRAGLSSAVHAIGDAAVELALTVLSAVPAAAVPHRIEHVQLCPRELWEMAGRSGVVGSVQPAHILTDAPVAERWWGRERSAGAYPFSALERAGVVLAFGSDAPVETPDPRPGLFAAVQRGSWADWHTGRDGVAWFPEQRLTARSAVSAYTIGSAIAAGLADRRGALLPGFDADLVAWSIDPFRADPHEYATMECVCTMVGGDLVYWNGR